MNTEISYVEVLDNIVEGYYPYMTEGKKQVREKGVVIMPSDLATGRDDIALGNIREIHAYQKKLVYKLNI